ncbi:MAG: hypothetical protein Q7S44_01015 [bacterium]|nr:hypothetical protein [bacterium]
MRKFSAQRGSAQLVVVLLLLVGVVVGTYLMQQQTNLFPQAASKKTPKVAQTSTGNGAPSGTHYNLNIIGVPKDKTADMTGSSGHRIFVPLQGSCKINLSMGDFQVIDGNCTDGPASFQLPNPDPTNSGYTTYSVYARALGKPGGSSSMTPCATDPLSGDTYCSVYTTVSVRSTGKSTFTNISKQLLYVYADINGDGNIERYPLFDSALQDYYWQYDNNGLKLLQLRFYPISTNVN